jgi:hypothetical protein
VAPCAGAFAVDLGGGFVGTRTGTGTADVDTGRDRAADRERERLEAVGRALDALGVDLGAAVDGGVVGGIEGAGFAELTRQIAEGVALTTARKGRDAAGVALRTMLDREVLLAVVVGGAGGDASSVTRRARLEAAAALAELCVALVRPGGEVRPITGNDGVAAGVVDGLVALVTEGGDYGRERAIATLGALVDRDLLDDLAWTFVDEGIDADAADEGGSSGGGMRLL